MGVHNDCTVSRLDYRGIDDLSFFGIDDVLANSGDHTPYGIRLPVSRFHKISRPVRGSHKTAFFSYTIFTQPLYIIKETKYFQETDIDY